MSKEQLGNSETEVGEHSNKELYKFLLDKNGQSLMINIQRSEKEGDIVKDEIQRRIAGFLFENLAYKFMKSQLKKDEILFSPQDVFELWGVLYPDAKAELHGGFNYSYLGISVPDGLIIEERPDNLSISSVVEYKTVSKKKNYYLIRKQARHFRKDVFAKELEDERVSERMGEAVNKLHNEIVSKPLTVDPYLKLIYVIPQDSFLRIENTRVIHAPVTKNNYFT